MAEDQINKVAIKLKRLQEEVEQFDGSDDAYYDIDTTITLCMTEMKNVKDPELRKQRKELAVALNKLCQTLDSKHCKKEDNVEITDALEQLGELKKRALALKEEKSILDDKINAVLMDAQKVEPKGIQEVEDVRKNVLASIRSINDRKVASEIDTDSNDPEYKSKVLKVEQIEEYYKKLKSLPVDDFETALYKANDDLMLLDIIPANRIAALKSKKKETSKTIMDFMDSLESKLEELVGGDKSLVAVIKRIRKGIANECQINEIRDDIVKLNAAIRSKINDEIEINGVMVQLYQCLFNFIPPTEENAKLRDSLRILVRTIADLKYENSK